MSELEPENIVRMIHGSVELNLDEKGSLVLSYNGDDGGYEEEVSINLTSHEMRCFGRSLIHCADNL